MERFYWFWLNNIPDVGNTKIRRLLERFGNAEEIFKTTAAKLKCVEGITEKNIAGIKDKELADNIYRRYLEYNKKKLSFVFPFEEKYPSKLKEIYDKPNILYYKGTLPDDSRKSVAIVGSRNCTEYGRYSAREIARFLSNNGIDVISGLALGIDSESHRSAIMSGGRTFAVLAGGTEKCYPPQNFNLYMDIIGNGGIISEYPPDTRTVPGLFPLRNRIISGLSDMVIIIEAGKKSGALITATQALEQNRNVMAVPSRFGEKYGEGCNHLIKEGACIVDSYDTILEELGIAISESKNEDTENLCLASEEKMLYSLFLEFTPISLETLTSESKLETGMVLRWLLSLEIKGLIKEVSQNFYVRIR